MQRTQPDMRPLGALALGAALVSVAFSWTLFFSHFAYLAAVVALPLGLMARSDASTRRMGTAAVVLTVIAIVVTTVMVITGV